MLDYHVHSTCSGDGKATIDQMCARAVELGIREIAFTEHVVYNPADICYGTFDLDRYRSEIDAARSKFDLKILTGIEFCDPHLYPHELAITHTWGLDIIMGSVHWVGDAMISVDSFAGLDVMETYRQYFDEVLKAVQTGGFDILAHFDLVKRFGVRYAPFRVESFREQIRAILEVMIERGIALELNTSGLRQPCAEMFPGRETLELYRSLGGRLVTIGSDSHRTEQLGFGLKEGLSLLQSLGFTPLTINH
jgi:histidinol-phosphatase (PHP family)